MNREREREGQTFYVHNENRLRPIPNIVTTRSSMLGDDLSQMIFAIYYTIGITNLNHTCFL